MSLEASVRLRRGTFELDVALAVEAGETAAILGPPAALRRREDAIRRRRRRSASNPDH
jgi:hypothetical protein